MPEQTASPTPAPCRYDYVIVGGGSAGCVLADRLTASGRHRVLLVEAGRRGPFPWTTIPAGIWKLMQDRALWWTQPVAAADSFGGRGPMMLQGRVLGGGSAVNGMLYMRGQRSDYDGWAAAGCPGWGWDDVLPYFKRSERLDQGGTEGAHGRDGPLRLSWVDDLHPVSHAFMAAAQGAGLPFDPDVNDGTQDGVGHLLATMYRGRRQSTASAFLARALRRPNLDLRTGAEVLRLAVDGARVSGIVLREADGSETTVRAGREVILSAGALGSPALLQRSGIGAAGHLSGLGLPVVLDRPEVGRNLQDHLFAHLKFATRTPRDSHNRVLTSNSRLAVEALRWALTRRGTLNMPTSQVTGFFRSDPAMADADLQLSMRPFSFHPTPGGLAVDETPAITVSAIQTRPHSRGSFRITAADPGPGALDMGWLTDDRDVAALVAGMRRLRAIMTRPEIAPRIAAEIEPGPRAEEAAALEAHLRAAASTVYHPVGSCRMGSDGRAVVDPALRLRGLAGCRVIDASVMPTIPSGNTNAPAIMIGEKGADLVLADAG